ncbi:chemotaxis protein CheD [Thiofaba sp. EF100]|jgi:chemotaxis protein CheD|uniref:chemotaxis protein CheD n=1 Tax=Thiofaba sp. EF100 TaxID=3121274 RepID=UPI0032215792
MLYLKPGEIYFGRKHAILRTLLGSCVAVTLWHPSRAVGGMCHVVLPHNPKAIPGRGGALEPDPRYADGAVAWLLERVRRLGTWPASYEVGVYGGGVMFGAAERRASLDIGRRNVEAVERALAASGFRIGERRVGGEIYRNVTLDLRLGKVGVIEQSVLVDAL